MKPARAAPTLDPSVEADGRAADLCTGPAQRDFARARILAWLAEGAREVTWALCWLPRERWAAVPPDPLGDWPALHHVRHVALHEAHTILPAVRQALGETAAESSPPPALDAEPTETAESLVRGLGATRFEMLQRLEAAPDGLWQRPLPVAVSETCGATSPVELDWLLLSARQHEQQHLAAVWRLALHWDRASLEPATRPGVPLHPADRLEESH